MQTQITISGFIVGPIWWPVGAEFFKPFTYDVTREEARMCNLRHAGQRLREHALAIVNDGDFQHCSIAQGELTIRMTRGSRSIERRFPLDHFAGVADLLHDDPDWFPAFDDEEEFA